MEDGIREQTRNGVTSIDLTLGAHVHENAESGKTSAADGVKIDVN
jgi:hypothetical protein